MPIAKKLYPPTLGKVPAFYGNILTVPFTMNRSVHKTDITGFAIIVKNILSDTLLINALPATSWDLDKMEAYFDVSNVNMVPGEYYKIQLAYMSVAGVGYYSSVSSVKCTSKPSITIVGLERHTVNLHMFHYTGQYSQKGMDQDTTEKVYSYHFDVYDSNEKLITTSGELVHNGLNDTVYHTSIDTFDFPKDLKVDEIYYIQYTVKTNNGLVASSPRYKLIQHHSIDPEMQADLLVSNNFDNGYVTLALSGKIGESGLEIPATGLFSVSRSSSNDDFMIWNEVAKFSMQAQLPSSWSWRDFTTEQGVTYQYSIQQYNDAGLYSNRILSEKIRADFEDAFLYDGERQLKVKYNPKVATFKSDLQEAKQETIGGKYPFIFRNGNINYKEFSLSGLLSYYSDEEELFISKNDLQFEGYTIDLITSNLYSERIFKLKAYEWLTDGKPKMFRSPGEGNYIVRLLNATMAPVDPTGRMLHTFTCSAYEIAESSYENLDKYNFIQIEQASEKQLRWETIELWKLKQSNEDILLNKHPAVMAEFIGMTPGEKVLIDGVPVTIGATGGYLLNDIKDEISEIKLPAYGHGSGHLTYGYYATKEVAFDTVTDFEIVDIADRQFIGEHNILNEIVDARTVVERWHIYNFQLRPILSLYYQDLGRISGETATPYMLYYDSLCTERVKDFSILDPWYLYELRPAQLNQGVIVYLKDGAKDIYKRAISRSLTGYGTSWKIKNIQRRGSEYVYLLADPENPAFELPLVNSNAFAEVISDVTHYYDYFNDKLIKVADYDPCVYIDGNAISLKEIKKYYLRAPSIPKSLTQGNGVVGHVSLRTRVTTYRLENTNDVVKEAKEKYLDALQTLKNWLFGTAYDLDLIRRHWHDDFKPENEHWSGIGIGCNEELYDDSTYDEKLGFTGALIWTNLDEGLNSHWMKLGADITYSEIAFEEPPLNNEDYTWMTCCSIMEGEEIPSYYLSGYVLAGAQWTTEEHYLYDTPANWAKVWVDLTPNEVTGKKPYLSDSRWMQAYTNLEGLVLGMYQGDTEIGFWLYDDPTEEELMARRPIIKEINGKRETDYIKVIAAQRKKVYELYRDYIEKLKAALAEDEEARRQ